ncbi:MAG: hypothetical protein RBS73_08320 [Prolixibacteraceae bacterium]|jgi:hypothetical protein|nr:hypothetical protein [Prolixibacteraceae bacterium]
MNNKVDKQLSDEEKTEILQLIATLRGKMPFLIKLSNDERKTMVFMDDGRKPFANKSFDYAARNSELSPGAEMVASGARDLNLFSFLSVAESELGQLYEMVRDTKQAAGSEAFEVARFIYKKAKMALEMGMPGMQTIVDDLGKLFKSTPSSNGGNPDPR